MTKEEYISLAVCKIRNKKERQLVREELSDHIDERVNFYSDCGYDAKTAFEKAVSHMGSPETAAQQLGMVHSTLLETIGSVFASLVGLTTFLILGAVYVVTMLDMVHDTLHFYYTDILIIEIISLFVSVGFAMYANYKKNNLLSGVSALFISFTVLPGILYLLISGFMAAFGLLVHLNSDALELFSGLYNNAQEMFDIAYQHVLNIHSPLIITFFAIITGNAECLSAMDKLKTIYYNYLPVSIATIIFYAAVALCIFMSCRSVHRVNSVKASKKDCDKRRILMRHLVCFAFCIAVVFVTGMVGYYTTGYKNDGCIYCTGFYIVESDSMTDFDSVDYENARKIKLAHNPELELMYDRAYIYETADNDYDYFALTQKKKMELPGAEYEYNIIKKEHRPSKRYVALVPECNINSLGQNPGEDAKPDYSSAHWVDTYSTDVFTQNYKPNKYPELIFEITLIK